MDAARTVSVCMAAAAPDMTDTGQTAADMAGAITGGHTDQAATDEKDNAMILRTKGSPV